MSGSNCRIDADCGAGGYCSRSFAPDYCNGHDAICGFNCGFGYFCHTPKDTCADDTDCAGLHCLYDVDTQSWACVAAPCGA